ncbi:MAG: DnaD domain protein [Clostridium sp.]|nr:DnaD domain protein [Clostridium sp.]MCI7443247.1 DnaD domain protein [Clostridium sp.]
MSTFMLKNTNLNFTPVSNVFIEKYMPNARGEFVKVYLLMLKHSIAGEPGISGPILASSLNLLESDIMNALNYWSDLGVIKLTSIDPMNNFSIEFLDLSEDNFTPNKEVNLLDALENKGINDMLKDIEKILGRTLSTKEMEMYLGWQKEFSFPSELILLLVEYCASKGKSDYRYIEKVALTWHDMNITTMAQAQNYIKQTEDKWVKIREILSYLGIKNNDLMKPQEEMIDKWLTTYNFDLDVIKKACNICADRLNRADFKYIDGILTNWFNNNIKTLDDIAIKDKQFKKNYKKNTYNKNNSSNGFNNFEARSYDYEALERKLLGWDSDD